jgi:hypothetical protein
MIAFHAIVTFLPAFRNGKSHPFFDNGITLLSSLVIETARQDRITPE